MKLAETLSLQKALNQTGLFPQLVEDGLLGPKTEAALAAAQAALEGPPQNETQMQTQTKVALVLGVVLLGLVLWRKRRCEDEESAALIDLMQPAAAAALRRAICGMKRRGVEVKVKSTLRTFAEQEALYNSGRGVTSARAGQSYHNYGLAADLYPVINGKVSLDAPKEVWQIIAEETKKQGFQSGFLNWGKDYYHHQYTSDGSPAETRALLAQFPNGWQPQT